MVLPHPFSKWLISYNPIITHSSLLLPHQENNFLPQKSSLNKSNGGLVLTFKLYQLHPHHRFQLFFLCFHTKLFYSAAAPLRQKTKSIKWCVETGWLKDSNFHYAGVSRPYLNTHDFNHKISAYHSGECEDGCRLECCIV